MDLTAIKEEIFGVIPGIEKSKPVIELDAEKLSQASFYKNWVYKNKPCLIKGAVKHWPGVEKWKEKTYWDTIYENEFDIDINPNRNYNSRERQVKNTMRIPFREAIAMLFDKEDNILSIPSEVISEHYNKELLQDMTGFPFLTQPIKPRGFPECRYFLYKNAATGWHYHDCDETLMCQVKGNKAVALLSDRLPDAKNVTHFLNEEKYIHGEKLDPQLQFESYTTHVEEGDALYIPINWFHAVVPTQSNFGITIAYCWGNQLKKYGDLQKYLNRKMYMQVLWPLGLYTFLMPFIFLYAVFAFYTTKLFQQS